MRASRIVVWVAFAIAIVAVVPGLRRGHHDPRVERAAREARFPPGSDRPAVVPTQAPRIPPLLPAGRETPVLDDARALVLRLTDAVDAGRTTEVAKLTDLLVHLGPAAIPAVAEVLTTPPPPATCRILVEALGCMRGRGAFELLEATALELETPEWGSAAADPTVRRALVHALARSGGHSALDCLVRLVEDPAWSCAEPDLADAIVATGYRRDAAELRERWSGAEPPARIRAILDRLAMKSEDAARKFEGGELDSPDPEVARRALHRLEAAVKAGDPAAWDRLQGAALTPPDRPIGVARLEIYAALVRLGALAGRRADVDRTLRAWLAAAPGSADVAAMAEAIAHHGSRADAWVMAGWSAATDPRLRRALAAFEARCPER